LHLLTAQIWVHLEQYQALGRSIYIERPNFFITQDERPRNQVFSAESLIIEKETSF
jgi:hypothetical protein